VSSQNRTVSIVDDDEDICLLFNDTLKSIKGINILTFIDPIMALQDFQINEYAYVLVISDFRMPGLNGMELLKKIKDLNRFVRTITMTGFKADNKLFQEYTKKKIINASLQKPIRLHDLIMEVNKQLGSYEQQKIIPS
jgi:DNA-binding NtrC family response regulator